MPSKPFYSIEEVCSKLGKSEDEIKGLVREGTLREFRDAGKIFFKAEDIEKLAPDAAPADVAPPSGDTGEILLEAVEPASDSADDTGAADDDLTTLSDSVGGTSIIGLEPLPDEEAPDEKKEDTVITASGIGVFDDDELEIDADPMAKTQITTGAADDQVSLEGSGSGSGLLDLAREADDTALGADLLDEIYPGEDEAQPDEAVEAEAVEAVEEEEAVEAEAEEEAVAEAEEDDYAMAPDAGEVLVPVTAVAADPAEGPLTGFLIGGLLLMGLATTVVAGVLQGYLPGIGKFLGDGSKFWMFLGGAAGLAVITLLLGWVAGRSFAPRRR